MVYFEKSQPAPECLEKEKHKHNGNYRCEGVVEMLGKDFKSKCYICEEKSTSFNVEHLVSYQGDINLKFSWNNLFLACGHCNNIKLNKYDSIINCTIKEENIEGRIKLLMNPFPKETVKVIALDENNSTKLTVELLNKVYNHGVTDLKNLDSANIRNKILDEIQDFQRNLTDYYKTINEDDKKHYLVKIKNHLSKNSSFTAFKRWIIKDNLVLKSQFEKYFD